MKSDIRVYFDSCCFIDLVKYDINENHPSLNSERVQDIWFLRQFCEAARQKDLSIIASTLTIAECLHLGEDGSITDEAKVLFQRFLTSGQIVTLVDADLFVASEARDLRWKHNINVAGADGIHLASAMITKCQEFITTDEQLKKEKIINAVSGLRKLGLKLIRASQTEQLPREYRQGKLL